MSPLLSIPPTDSAGFTGAGDMLPGGSSAIPTYVVWYDHSTKPWTTAQKQIVIDWINGIGGTAWWQTVRDYPDQGGNVATAGMTFVAGVDDTEAEGTNWNCSNAADPPFTAVAAQVTANSWPNNGTALYIIATSDTDITLSCGAQGFNAIVGSSGFGTHTGYTMAAVVRAALAGFPSPNGDAAFDSQMWFMGHEVQEGITTGWTDSGGNQIGDRCASPNLYLSNAYAVGSTYANVQLVGAGSVTRNYAMQDMWTREEGGRCTNGLQPAPLTLSPPAGGLPAQTIFNCGGNAQCLWSHHCSASAGRCAEDTCSDGILNGWESDTDCGATCGMPFTSQYVGTCATGKRCFTNLDCASVNCVAGICH